MALSLSVLPSISTSCFDCSLSYKPPSPVLLYRIKSGTENAAYLLVRHRLGTSKICRQRVTAGRLVGDIVSRRRISDLLRVQGLSSTRCRMSQQSRHMQSLGAGLALKLFTLVIDAPRGGERGTTDTAPDMYYSSRQVMINRAHARKLNVSMLRSVVR